LTYTHRLRMLVCMKRTTLVLEEGVLEAIRESAHQDRRDMSDLVNELLRDGLQLRKKTVAVEIAPPVFSMGRPRANLADRDALENLMERP